MFFIKRYPLKLFCRTFVQRFAFYSQGNSSTTQENNEPVDNWNEDSMYPEHIPSSLFQKILLTIGSATMAITDPYRDDMIAVLGETTGYMALQKIREKMMKDPEGASILHDKPRINSQTVDLDYLKSLPEGTLGHRYMSFLAINRVSPDTRLPVHFVDDAELAYVMQRYREIHDLVHAILSMPTNMIGEVTVKWVEAIQTGLPMCAAGALFGPLRFNSRQRKKYITSYLPWALQCGYKAKFLMNVYYEQRWEQNMDSLLKELNIPEQHAISGISSKCTTP